MEIWSRVKCIFETCDGSLPDIVFKVDELALLSTAYVTVRDNSCSISEGAFYWSSRVNGAIPITISDNPAEALVKGYAEPFHIVFEGVETLSGCRVPDLGVYVYPNKFVLDYRKGDPKWDRYSVLGFFEILDQLSNILGSNWIHQLNVDDCKNELWKIWSDTASSR